MDRLYSVSARWLPNPVWGVHNLRSQRACEVSSVPTRLFFTKSAIPACGSCGFGTVAGILAELVRESSENPDASMV
jgi:hypothetical protein